MSVRLISRRVDTFKLYQVFMTGGGLALLTFGTLWMLGHSLMEISHSEGSKLIADATLAATPLHFKPT
jgi:hypothetical protein